jgi:hypothetical protein
MGTVMKWLALLIVVGAGAFFGYPLLNENSSNECDALERVAVRTAMGTDNQKPQPQDQLLGQFFQGLSRGQFASVAVRNEYPNTPVTVACTMLYWRALTDPKGFREGAGKLR